MNHCGRPKSAIAGDSSDDPHICCYIIHLDPAWKTPRLDDAPRVTAKHGKAKLTWPGDETRTRPLQLMGQAGARLPTQLLGSRSSPNATVGIPSSISGLGALMLAQASGILRRPIFPPERPSAGLWHALCVSLCCTVTCGLNELHANVLRDRNVIVMLPPSLSLPCCLPLPLSHTRHGVEHFGLTSSSPPRHTHTHTHTRPIDVKAPRLCVWA